MDKNSQTPILEVKNLKQYFYPTRKFTVKAVDGISFKIMPGETYGLVGESGSGKSTTGRLNPRKKVIDIIAQGLDIHHDYKDEKEREEKVYKILEMVGLSKEHANRFPHQFSGGQRQRIGIARALIMNPDLIIADEAISALDVSIQAQVVNLMKKMQKETGAAYLFIAHDLSMVKYISDRIGVLHLGHLVETGTADEIFSNPLHPYTRSLLSAIPHSNPRVEKVRKSFSYDYETSGLDYAAGTQHQITDTHFVLGTDEDVEQFKKDAANFKL